MSGAAETILGRDGIRLDEACTQIRQTNGSIREHDVNLRADQILQRSQWHKQSRTFAVFDDARDGFYGSFETLTENRDKAIELLALAINKPRT